jgi:hypothetical protein
MRRRGVLACVGRQSIAKPRSDPGLFADVVAQSMMVEIQQ